MAPFRTDVDQYLHQMAFKLGACIQHMLWAAETLVSYTKGSYTKH